MKYKAHKPQRLHRAVWALCRNLFKERRQDPRPLKAGDVSDDGHGDLPLRQVAGLKSCHPSMHSSQSLTKSAAPPAVLQHAVHGSAITCMNTSGGAKTNIAETKAQAQLAAEAESDGCLLCGDRLRLLRPCRQ